MKLYYTPGACSLSPSIALHEAGIPFEAIKVDLAKRTLPDGSAYTAVNPLGYIPAIILDSGEILTEGPAIVQYLADLAPEKKLAPANGTFARYKLQSWLNLIATELHKSFTPLFKPHTTDAEKERVKEYLVGRFTWLDQELAKHTYLTGEDFTVAEGYLFVVTLWAKYFHLNLDHLTHLQAWFDRVANRPAVKAALAADH